MASNSFQWNEIENQWLLKIPTSLPKEEILYSFKRLDEELGHDFFKKYNFIRGEFIINLVKDLALVLDEVQKGNCILPKNGEVMQRINENKVHNSNHIIQLAAYFLKKGFTVEFEPEVNNKKPDLRVNFNSQWFYIEETKLYTSRRFTEILRVMDTISETIQTINRNIHINIILLKEDLTTEEIKRIIDAILNISSLDLPHFFEIEQLVRINTSNRFLDNSETERPSLCNDCLLVGNGFERHLHIEIQFSDIRLNKIIKKKN